MIRRPLPNLIASACARESNNYRQFKDVQSNGSYEAAREWQTTISEEDGRGGENTDRSVAEEEEEEEARPRNRLRRSDDAEDVTPPTAAASSSSKEPSPPL